MHLVLKIIAATAAVSVVFTIWLIVMLVGPRGFGPLLNAGMLGVMTLLGWAVTLVLGPFAAFQLWRHRESGRVAGLVLFGFGVVYYVVGFFALRAPEADPGQIAAAAIAYALPVVILASPPARKACSQ